MDKQKKLIFYKKRYIITLYLKHAENLIEKFKTIKRQAVIYIELKIHGENIMERKRTNLKIILLMCLTVISVITMGFIWSYVYENNTLKMTNKIMSNELYGNGDEIRGDFENLNSIIDAFSDENIDLNSIIARLSKESIKKIYNIDNVFIYDSTKSGQDTVKIDSEVFENTDDYFIGLRESNDGISPEIIMYKPIFKGKMYLGYVGIVFEENYLNTSIKNINTFNRQSNLILDTNTHKTYISENEKWILDDENNILDLQQYISENISDNELLTFIEIIDNQKYNIYAYKNEKQNFVVVSIVDYREFVLKNETKFQVLIVMIIVIGCLVIGIYYINNKNSNKPTDKILNVINRVNKGDLSVRYTESNEKDIDKIGEAVNILVENLENDRNLNDKISYIDSLTKINNRAKFLMDGSSVLFGEEKEEYSLIKFDIDKFKYINDIHGYDFGDKIIKLIADKLREFVKDDGDYFARGTDDNFVVLIKETEDERLIEWIENFVNLFNGFKDDRGRALKINFSFGIYKLEDSDDDFEKIIDKANIAQESAKLIANHKSTYNFYDFEMKQAILKERKIENVMYDALENKEFVIYLQAKNDLNTLNIVGAEALIRWISKDFGFISPGDFIPIFEKNGFVVEIDFYVFEEVCKKIRYWLDNNIEPVVISVNQSKRHLEHDDYVERLIRIIKKYKVPAKYIELEITEATVLHNIEKLIHVIDELHEIGFNISIDDFGSGYSSLNLLKEINADILKIDRGFLKEVEDSNKSKTIIRHVIEMAKELNIKTITEGVEKEEQAEFLRNMGCDMAQGFLYAKPIAIPEFEEKYITSRKKPEKEKETKKEKRERKRKRNRDKNKNKNKK